MRMQLTLALTIAHGSPDINRNPLHRSLFARSLWQPRARVGYNAAMAPSFIRARVREMAGYTPGEQPLPEERVVKLNTNENPFPPSDKVMQAIQNIDRETLRRYPNPTADSFR